MAVERYRLVAAVAAWGAWNCAAAAMAALPHWHRPQAGVYRPIVQEYVVVVPVAPDLMAPAGADQPVPGGLHGHGVLVWRQQALPGVMYPWGWFGAGRHPYNVSHTRYYGDTHDWSLRRGY